MQIAGRFPLTKPCGKGYVTGAVRNRALVAAALLFLVSPSSYAAAQAPLPILRGIIVLSSGEARAYFEDALTGHLAGYAVRDAIGESQIEEIRYNRVVLRHGGDVVHLFLGGQSPINDPKNRVGASGTTPPLVALGTSWLERLGIPPKALSRAIELAIPSKYPDNLDD